MTKKTWPAIRSSAPPAPFWTGPSAMPVSTGPTSYVTNAVKHFKFEERGKRRIHKKPSTVEIVACKPWLEAEVAIVRPELIVCLGATAARAVIGPKHRLLEDRGQFFDHPWSASVTATVHPSAVLRSPDPEQRHTNYQAFVNDLIAVRKRLSGVAKAH